DVDTWLAALAGVLAGDEAVASADDRSAALVTAPMSSSPEPVEQEASTARRDRRAADRVLRVTAENLNRLLSLAGESLVESRWVKPFAAALLRLKRQHHQLGKTLAK